MAGQGGGAAGGGRGAFGGLCGGGRVLAVWVWSGGGASSFETGSESSGRGRAVKRFIGSTHDSPNDTEGTATPTQLQQKQPLAVSAIGDAKAETRHHTNFQ